MATDKTDDLAGMTQQSYEVLGQGYSAHRRPDPRLHAEILSALGDTRTVLNAGAGTGSYEPTDRFVVAAEPSLTMIQQRASGAAPVVQATAESLPFADKTFDAALAVLTVHHWQDWRQGVRELRRVARKRVVILTHDTSASSLFWLVNAYFPEIPEIDRLRMPPIQDLRNELGHTTLTAVPIPADCTDGFLGAYWQRPQAYLDANVRRAISVFHKVRNEIEGIEKLRRDLDSGKWRLRHSDLMSRETFDLGYRLIVATVERL